MTVSELIELLSKLPPDYTVAMESQDGMLGISLDEHSIVYSDESKQVLFTFN